MSTLKKCKIVMLSTEKAKGFLSKSLSNLSPRKLELGSTNINNEFWEDQHLYVLSDDEIKEGDWVLVNNIHVRQVTKSTCDISEKYLEVNGFNGVLKSVCKKIITTTDTSLLPECVCSENAAIYCGSKCQKPLHQPSESFIQKYIDKYNKGEQITEVMVEYNNKVYANGQVIIDETVKINPKDSTITIKKVKDSWARDEVIELLQQVIKDVDSQELTEHYGGDYRNLNEWIEENL